MELKNRSKSTYIPGKIGLMDGPRLKTKLHNGLLSPINLSAKGLKDLKKNKNANILLETESYYLSCPDEDDLSDCSTNYKDSTALSRKGTTIMRDNKPKESKLLKSIKFNLLPDEYSELGNGLTVSNKIFSLDDNRIVPSSVTKRSEDMTLDKTCGYRASLKKGISSKTTKLSMRKPRDDIKNFILEELDENDYFDDKETVALDLRGGSKSTIFLNIDRKRTFTSILSKLSQNRIKEDNDEDSD